MKEKIPYWLIQFLPFGHALAHGEANLDRPLRFPGRFSIVGGDYLDNIKNYTRVHQPALPLTSSINESNRRNCQKCHAVASVEIPVFCCSSCRKWFHNECHLPNGPTCNIINPY